MGVSTDAILCYGFRLTDEGGYEGEIIIDWLSGDPPDGNGEGDGMIGFDDFLAKVAGVKAPDSHFDKVKYDGDPKYQQTWSEYWDKIGKLEEECKVTLVRHCSGECTMYILAVKESVQKARRGYPIELCQEIVTPLHWRGTLHDFCERASIPFEEPQLILCSMWN